MIAVEFWLPRFEKEAKERMSEGGKGRVNLPDLGRSRDFAGEKVGLSGDVIK